jgi:putative GTP pyrophosphokinase
LAGRRSATAGSPRHADDLDDARARQIVEWWRAQHERPMIEVYEAVKGWAPVLDLGETRLLAVSFRPKRVESAIEKLTREPGKLADMVDIGGVRAVVNDQDEVNALQAQLGRILEIRRVRDWASNPRSTGYRAVHLHVRQAGYMIEVQLRTFGQDAWANAVEEEARFSGMNYKVGEGHESVLAFFRLVGDLFGAIELGETHQGLPERLFTAYEAARPHLRTPTLRQLKP